MSRTTAENVEFARCDGASRPVTESPEDVLRAALAEAREVICALRDAGQGVLDNLHGGDPARSLNALEEAITDANMILHNRTYRP